MNTDACAMCIESGWVVTASYNYCVDISWHKLWGWWNCSSLWSTVIFVSSACYFAMLRFQVIVEITLYFSTIQLEIMQLQLVTSLLTAHCSLWWPTGLCTAHYDDQLQKCSHTYSLNSAGKLVDPQLQVDVRERGGIPAPSHAKHWHILHIHVVLLVYV